MANRGTDTPAPPSAAEYVRCNLCGADDYKPYYAQQDRRYDHTPRGVYTLVRCTKCGLIYLNPRPIPERMLAFYPSIFYEGLDEPPGPRRANERRWKRAFDLPALRERMALREKMGIVARYCSRPGRLLDVGPGRGGFLAAMKKRGWSVVGVDISADMCEHIRTLHGIECVRSDFAELSYPTGSVDVVTFWASFEHQRDPAAALDVCRRILSPAGIVVILVPNAKSIEERLLGRVDPNPIDLPRHFYHFSEETLQLMLSRKGFAVVSTRHFTLNAYDRISVIVNARALRIPPRGALGRMSRLLLETAGFAVGDGVAGLLGAARRAHSFVVIARACGESCAGETV
jgi:SAM-dependent methyltransferase